MVRPINGEKNSVQNVSLSLRDVKRCCFECEFDNASRSKRVWMDPMSRQILIAIHTMNPNYPHFQLASTSASSKDRLPIWKLSKSLLISVSKKCLSTLSSLPIGWDENVLAKSQVLRPIFVLLRRFLCLSTRILLCHLTFVIQSDLLL